MSTKKKLVRRPQPPAIAEDAITQAHIDLVIKVFEIASRDCETGTKRDAIRALRFFCSPYAEDLAAYLIDCSAHEAVTSIAGRYWDCIRDRFGEGLTVADLCTK